MKSRTWSWLRGTPIAVLLFTTACGEDSPVAPDPAGETLASFAVEAPALAGDGESFDVDVTAIGSQGTTPFGFDGALSVSASAGTLSSTSVTLIGGTGTLSTSISGALGPIEITVTGNGKAGRTTTNVASSALVGNDNDPATAAIPTFVYDPNIGVYRNDAPGLEGLLVSTNTILVQLEPTTTIAQANALLASQGARIVGGARGSAAHTGTLILNLPTQSHEELAQVLTQLEGDARVRRVVRDSRLEPGFEPRDNGGTPANWTWQQTVGGGNWGMELIRAPQMWNMVATIPAGSGTSVGIGDNGFPAVMSPHEDLSFWSAEGTTGEDHGTHVAGIVGASFDNGRGVDGIDPLAQMHVYGTDFSIASVLTVIRYLVDNYAVRVMNWSYGIEWPLVGTNPGTSSSLQASVIASAELYEELLEQLEDEDTLPLIAVAAGNDSNGGLGLVDAQWASGLAHAGLTLGWDNILVVEAIQHRPDLVEQAGPAAFSNAYGHVSAPGDDIMSTKVSTNYGSFDGTSMASPHVAGLMSFLLTVDPTLTNAQVRDLVLSNTKRVGGVLGRPRIDAWASMMDIDRVQGSTDVLRRWCDIDDGSADGNQRVDELGNVNAVEDLDGNGVRGDGDVDMSDFRRWRDWMLQLEDSPDLFLNGAPDHPKKDVDGNGEVEALVFENAYSRGDLNGDGAQSRELSSEVPGAIGRSLTDLEVLQEIFEDPHYGAAELSGLVDSGDLEVSPKRCFADPEVTTVETTVRYDGSTIDVRVHEDADQRHIFTLLVAEEIPYEVTMRGKDADGGTVAGAEDSFFVALGGDIFWEPDCGTPSLAIAIAFASTVEPGVPMPLTVSVSSTGDLEGTDLDIDVDCGDVGEYPSTLGATGTIQTTATLDENCNSTVIEVTARPPLGSSDDEVTETVRAFRPSSIAIESRDSYVYAQTSFYYEDPDTGVFEWRYKPNVWTDANHFNEFTAERSTNAHGDAEGMSGSGEAFATHTSDISLSGLNFSGATFSTEANGSGSLTNPHPLSYGASTSSGSSLTVEFTVWGTEGSFSIDMNMPSGAYTESYLAFEGSPFDEDDDIEICFYNGQVCSEFKAARDLNLVPVYEADGSLKGIQGRLPAGEYCFDVSAGGNLQFSGNEGDPAAGSGSYDLSMTASLSVSAGSNAAGPAETLAANKR